jgi:phage shock protein A
MGLFQRAHEIIEAKANKALDSAEKPDEMLDLSYEKMLEQITAVKRSLVDIAASRKQLELQEQQLQHSVDHLQDQAKQALGAGREDLAKEALARKATAQAQIDGMEPQHQQLSEEEDKLTHTLQALQERVNQFRSQKEVLKRSTPRPRP